MGWEVGFGPAWTGYAILLKINLGGGHLCLQHFIGISWFHTAKPRAAVFALRMFFVHWPPSAKSTLYMRDITFKAGPSIKKYFSESNVQIKVYLVLSYEGHNV
jgi:hypothetical protein